MTFDLTNELQSRLRDENGLQQKKKKKKKKILSQSDKKLKSHEIILPDLYI